jgi:hypothetical protein
MGHARCSARLALTAISMLLAAGCDPAPAQDPEPPHVGPLLVVGLDGLEWSVLLDLLAEDELPGIAALIERGAAGLLTTLEPTSSPVVWTSIATGKRPERHGIRGFVRKDDRGRRTLYTSADRTTKAIWNIASDYGRSVCTIGWWMTYPVEPIHGTMVAQTNTLPKLHSIWKGRLLKGVPGQVHPPERQNEVMRILEASEAGLDALRDEVFGSFPHPLGPFEEMFWEKAGWAFRADATYRRIALELLRKDEPCELMLVYLGGTDVVGHFFWRYYQPELFTPSPEPEQVENFGTVVRDYYVFADRVVSELVEAAAPDTSVFVVSDHGMLPAPEPANPLVELAGVSGQHGGAPPGVLIAAGPAIRSAPTERPPAQLRREDLPTLGSVLDLAPTLLALLRIPVGRDMEGEVLTHLLAEEIAALEPPPPVATHDTAAFRTPRPRPPIPEAVEEERLEQLRALGYIGEDEPRPPR